ncbi:MAG: HAMP domain-containing histidine kinase [Actinomycetota bacterium]|nr:HAMP domain-containing histidine kinase [Actinomycetota bacterium]
MKLARTAAAALLFFAGALAITLASGAYVFGVPRGDVVAVAVLLCGVGGGVGLAALLLLHPEVLGRVGGVRGHIAGAGLISSLLLLGMVLGGARAMFISGHDLSVLLTMLLFAGLLAVGFSLYGAGPLARRIEELRRGTARLAAGDLDTEVPADGHDELAMLAGDFNRMARELREAAAREREMDKARRDLVAAVSHDLRTPIASARALIEAVADGVTGDAEMEARYLASARGEIEKLGRLVDDLFELSRIDAGMLRLELEEASLRDLISDTLSSFKPRAEDKGVSIIGEVSDGVDPVLASPPRLQRVLDNLLGNALRHTPPGGEIHLRVEPGDGVARVEVSDTGEGIAREDLPYVFDRSFRGERSRASGGDDSGAGLGLAIARGLIEAHGGEIGVESHSGHGSRFRFTLLRAPTGS